MTANEQQCNMTQMQIWKTLQYGNANRDWVFYAKFRGILAQRAWFWPSCVQLKNVVACWWWGLVLLSKLDHVRYFAEQLCSTWSHHHVAVISSSCKLFDGIYHEYLQCSAVFYCTAQHLSIPWPFLLASLIATISLDLFHRSVLQTFGIMHNWIAFTLQFVRVVNTIPYAYHKVLTMHKCIGNRPCV